MRDKVFLTSKVEVTRAGRTKQAFEKVLGELKTDYLDAILIHGTPGLEQMTVTEAMKVRFMLSTSLSFADILLTPFARLAISSEPAVSVFSAASPR